MTDPAHDTSGDFGYDMAHERAGDEKSRPPRPPRPARQAAPAPAAPEPDLGEDIGYDEAHDF